MPELLARGPRSGRLPAAVARAAKSVAAWTATTERIDLQTQRRLGRRVLGVVVLVVGLVVIAQWQRGFLEHRFPEKTLRSNAYVLAASGGLLGWQEEFVYFLYYLNLFPVATLAPDREFSLEGARKVVSTQGHTLVMERFWTIRYGDLLKTYLYLPQAYLKGKPNHPMMVVANGFAWAAALLVLFGAFWKAGYPLLGAILVALLGSNPFQVSEVFGRDNVFGWVITTGVLVLALHVSLFRDQRPSRASVVLVPVITGLLLGTMRHIRTEPVLIGASAVFAYLTVRVLRPRIRLAMAGALVAAFFGASAAWSAYFEAKFREAHAVVKAAGGHPYDGPRHAHHFVWHALFCGLGDFDTRYGYAWNDLVGIAYALPVMKARGFVAAGYPALERRPYDSLTLGVYWDEGRQYARTPFEVPEYGAAIREKVLGDITHDPLWYLTILAKRSWRLLTETTPPSLAFGDGRRWSLAAGWPWGFLPLAVAGLVLRARSTFMLKLLLFPLPLAGTALFVYSGEGTVYYAIAHLVAFGLCVAWLAEAALGWLLAHVVVGIVWRSRLHLIPEGAPALKAPRAAREGSA